MKTPHKIPDLSKVIIASVDLETLGLYSDAIITGIGAVLDGPRRRWTISHFPIDAVTDQHRRTCDPETINFWRTQRDDGLRLAFETSMAGRAGKAITLRVAMDDLLTQCESAVSYHGEGSSIFWIYKPAIFDGPLIETACKHLGGEFSTRLDKVSGGVYRRQALDLNSMKFLANMVGIEVPEFPKPSVLHDPSHDAGAQLKAYRLILEAVKARLAAIAALEAHIATLEGRDTVLDLPAVADAVAPVKPGASQLFSMVRANDESGVSGTGHVLDGVIWPDGRVTIYWRSATPSVNAFDSYADFLKVHVDSHPTNGTRIVFADSAMVQAASAELAATDRDKSHDTARTGAKLTKAMLHDAQAAPASQRFANTTDLVSKIKTGPAFEAQIAANSDNVPRVLKPADSEFGEVKALEMIPGTPALEVADELARKRGDEDRRIQRVISEATASRSTHGVSSKVSAEPDRQNSLLNVLRGVVASSTETLPGA